MATLVAINLAAERAVVVAAQTSPGGAISINQAVALDLTRVNEAPATETELSLSEGSAETSADETAYPTGEVISPPVSTNGKNGHAPLNLLQQAIDSEIDATLATLQSQQVLFGYLKLPFNDQKKLDQTVPLQVQDFVPFELDRFLIGNWVTGQDSDGEYDIITSLIPEDEVSKALQQLKDIGSDPKVLTILPGSILGLTSLCADVLSGTFALLVFAENSCGVAIFVEDKVRLVRELYLEQLPLPEDVYRELRCCIARIEYQFNLVLEKVFVVGAGELAADISVGLRQEVTHLDLQQYVSQDPNLSVDVNNLGWAVGLIAAESLGSTKNTPSLDYRLGTYAYKPAWGNFLAAIREQRVYLLISAVIVLAWAGTLFFSVQKELSAVNDAISERVSTVFPGEAIYSGQEDTFLESRTQEVRDELNDLGSLAPLSPLESLTELSKVIPPALDVQVESLKIREDLTITGTVPGYKEAGALKSSLEGASEKFCEITINPTKSAGAARVTFIAVVKFCS